MNITSEQISHALDETLKEYAKASSMSATSSDIEKAQKRHAATFSGLNKQLAQEFVGMVRLAAIAKLAGEPSALQRNPEKADYIPDFIIKDIPWDKAHAALDKHLGKREEDYGFSALKEELEAGPAGDDEDEKIARYKQFRAELSDKINAGGLFIDGKSPLEGVNLDFKEYVSNFWDSREEIFKIQLEKDTEALIGFLRGKLEEPTGRPLTPTPQLAEAVMPSAIGKDRKYADLYKKILNILNKKRSEIDKEINPALELHVETVEGFKGKYKAQNNQPRRHWGYRGPNTSSEKGWEKFVESLKELKRATIEEAKKDIAAASEEITDLTPIITESDDGTGALQEDKLNKIVIDFNELRKQELNESFLAMFGGWVEHILGAMFGNYSLPVNIRGSKREVESFASALGREKRYLDAAKRYGLDHPTTYKSRSSLDTAVKGFEKDTGLKWPFK